MIKGIVEIHRLNKGTFERELTEQNIPFKILKDEPFCDVEFEIELHGLNNAIWIGRLYQMRLNNEVRRDIELEGRNGK